MKAHWPSAWRALQLSTLDFRGVYRQPSSLVVTGQKVRDSSQTWYPTLDASNLSCTSPQKREKPLWFPRRLSLSRVLF